MLGGGAIDGDVSGWWCYRRWQCWVVVLLAVALLGGGAIGGGCAGWWCYRQRRCWVVVL